MRILWHSVAPWTPTGYGQQTGIFTTRLRDLGHEVTISATYGLHGAILEYEDMRVLPSDDHWGNHLLPEYASRLDAELVITLMDVWSLKPDRIRDLPLACWTPIDHEPCPPAVAEMLHLSGARPIAMSKFGELALRQQGLEPLYVPHGIDTNVFKPEGREEVRDAGGYTDKFLVGIVANNSGGRKPVSGPPRKAFPESFQAFSIFYHQHPDARLYLHTELSGKPGIQHGINLTRLLDRFEIPPEAIKAINQTQWETGLPSQDLAKLYASMDVLLNPSYGEGFGIPIVEAQACGTPVIVNNCTSMPELCGAGWVIDGQPWYDPDEQRGEAFFKAPSVDLIVEALEEAYETRADEKRRVAAREFAMQYDADVVTEKFWKPALEALGNPREVPPLPNRAARRAAAKATA